MSSTISVARRTPPSQTSLGPLLRQWRVHRGLSQLALALEANVSQRHLSFVESGRSGPSREMIGRIAHALDLPLRARNELLVAAGFAPTYGERSLDQADMDGVRDILTRILTHHDPYPAMVLDRAWNFVMRNAANRRIVSTLLDGVDPEAAAPGHPVNFLRLMFAEHGLRRRVRNWDQVGPGLLARLRREARAYPGSPSELLLGELAPDAERWVDTRPGHDLPAPTIPLELEIRPGLVVRLTNTLTTFGTPLDVNVQELRIEMSFPMDDVSEAYLRDVQ
jgi:transcriptional regulator with XRE-family HTH domain